MLHCKRRPLTFRRIQYYSVWGYKIYIEISKGKSIIFAFTRDRLYYDFILHNVSLIRSSDQHRRQSFRTDQNYKQIIYP